MTRVSPRRTPRPAAVILVLAAACAAPPASAGLRFRQVPTLHGAVATALASDGTTVWAGTPRGVWSFSSGAWAPDGLPGRPIASLAVADSVYAADGTTVRKRSAACAPSADPTAPCVPVWDAEAVPLSVTPVRARDRRDQRLGRGPRSREEIGARGRRSPARGRRVLGRGLERRPRRRAAGKRRALRGLLRLVSDHGDAGDRERSGPRVRRRNPLGRDGPDSLRVERRDVGRRAGLRVPRRPRDHGRGRRPQGRDRGRRHPEEVGLVGAGQRRHPRARSAQLRDGGLGPLRGHRGGPVYRLVGSSWDEAGAGLWAANISDVTDYSAAVGTSGVFASARGAGLAEISTTSGSLAGPGCGDVRALAQSGSTNLLAATNCDVTSFFLSSGASFSASAGLPLGVLPTTLARLADGSVAGGTPSAGMWRYTGSSWSADNGGLSGTSPSSRRGRWAARSTRRRAPRSS